MGMEIKRGENEYIFSVLVHSLLNQVSPNVLKHFCQTWLSKMGTTAVPPGPEEGELFTSTFGSRSQS